MTIATEMRCDGCGKAREEGEPLTGWLVVGPADGTMQPIHFHDGACYIRHGTAKKNTDELGIERPRAGRKTSGGTTRKAKSKAAGGKQARG